MRHVHCQILKSTSYIHLDTLVPPLPRHLVEVDDNIWILSLWRVTKTSVWRLCYDSETNQYLLEWGKERGTKTCNGENCNSHQRSFNPRAYETGDTRCPVDIYQLFISHRPIDSLTKNSPFFVAMKPQEKITDIIWYSNRPLGKNKIGKFLSNTTSILGQSNTSRSKVANHSTRKNSISTLLNTGMQVFRIHPDIRIETLHFNKFPDSGYELL